MAGTAFCLSFNTLFSQIGCADLKELNTESASPISFNQMTRWVMTKEEHCCKVITKISEYCLCQRVKPYGATGSPFQSEKDYIDALKAHHSAMQWAMKCKQSVDSSVADSLLHSIEDVGKMYKPV